ncbi:unnamed protein product [Phyllotreta striolata]|uniref:Uncharacterized protein n=1 Tax=Phyllotreta striolata TaxID=444603 RepID=A0A9N9XQG3_PHYSR|nr:unnamed protein product [Phyllotreta striolata]
MNGNLRCFVISLLVFNVLCADLLDTSRYFATRKKRALIWSDYGVSWVQFIFGLGLPVEVEKNAITMGYVFKAFYTLPTNASDYLSPSIDIQRNKRATSRWMFYEVLESLLARFNNGDGKSCLLKIICEVAESPFEHKAGILSEIVTAVLKPSITDEEFHHPTNMDYHAAEQLGTTEGNCDSYYPECKMNILEQYSRILI